MNMEYVVKLILEIFISIPGGFVRWLFIRKKIFFVGSSAVH